MAFQKFLPGSKAEAIDDCGIWCLCTVSAKNEISVTVSFDGWNAEWDRNICDPREIREVVADRGTKRKRSNISSKNPQISKIIKDVLWMGEEKAVVTEVDPIRGLIKVLLESNVEVIVGPEELALKKPEPVRVRQKRKRKQQEAKAAPEPSPPEPAQEPEPSPALLM